MTSGRIEIHPYDTVWRDEFSQIGSHLRRALGALAIRVDHIGSTSIEGLAAKPIIDVQVSVDMLEPMGRYLSSMKALGYVWREDNSERTKRYFREAPGSRRTHIHVRKAGSWHEQFALLFRDYVRVRSDERYRYERAKRELAEQFPNDRVAYTDAKAPVIWQIMQRADRWAADTGWEPGPSDA
jgi:GrpB-like predicted nucleotidyltransferase (UPF0157 family)